MVIHVGLGSFVGMMPRMKRVSPCGMGVMGGFFVLSGLIVTA